MHALLRLAAILLTCPTVALAQGTTPIVPPGFARGWAPILTPGAATATGPRAQVPATPAAPIAPLGPVRSVGPASLPPIAGRAVASSSPAFPNGFNAPPAAAAPPAAPGTMAQGEFCRAAIALAERERGIPPRLLHAIARVESGRRDPATGQFHPWPWTINAEGRGSFFPDKAAAVAAVRALQAQGVRSIDVGCMQINLRHHPNAFASLEEAFDPLANARYGARFLSDLQAVAGDWMRAAGRYHSHTPEFAEPYRNRVASAWESEQGGPAPSPAAVAALRSAPMATAPVPVPVMAAAVPPPRPPGGGGGFMLSNGAERVPVPVMAASGGGRGLDAYRALPIPLASRPVMPPRRF